MGKISFVTLSPECRNIELVKDVGQIPYILGKKYADIETSIVASCIDINGANLRDVPGLKIVHMPFILGNASLTGMLYLLRNSKKIDWLNIYHAGRRSYYWAKIYKFFNPNGKVYLKLDMDFRSCAMYDDNKWERKLFARNMMIMDLVTVESEAVKKRIEKYSDQDIYVLGNGYCKTGFQPDIHRKREDCFITVGRLGTEQKATDILLEAFAQSVPYHQWKIKLIGAIEDGFQSRLSYFFAKYPDIADRVIFTGEIKDRRKLYDEYCSAKVFVLPSRWESFAIVGGEALSCGCRLILSNLVPPMQEMTRNGKYGRIVEADNIEQLKQALILETKVETSQDEISEIKEYADIRFSWSLICDQLYGLLIMR